MIWFQTLAIVSVAYICCWSVNQIYYFMFNVGYPADYVSDFYHGTVLAVYLNVCINPVIYAAKYRQFQAAAVQLGRKILRLSSPPNSTASNAT